ncbi:hypothetical protein [Nocardia goodfellowii]|uniref:Lipoprotein n=1 Tax=Nocardia goodfellowii TaxID=882446 RepID=A0ABS4QDE6_9NOCA|nr:hypothetical protein [Nocardia goodfellowii]MBP2189144.1 hypothetical protein [Nocardia goodfellowii]
MRRLERAGLAAAAAATATGIIFLGACAKQIDGAAEANQTDLASYTSEVTASSISSSIAASSSKAAAAEAAIETACETFAEVTSKSITSFNAYIAAGEADAPDVDAKATDAVNTLRGGATELTAQLSADLPSRIADPLRVYRDDSNVVADNVERRVDVDTLNASVDKFNASKNTARDACLAG